ncbi:MAG: 50S ribosomal protein L22 [Candidatus Eisenbacteria bacterium]|uniref:Large ribosomal subunit protein uL22 n=1 Tax=Eiseniibacteriota bacterium TaxID=2212470 RepID=A0A948RWX0_UNCEI|nr:50S ribosomal protein L22 [Candidatus Eisenbacteria bacterium]MBU1948464.1 50S ribosomal protein L22 [Candidatus Eisenbacteria bacterium]MBU2691124.1 50S ribosomal protein L22 [Candidatus Eisenbacteria bacterium]
MEAKAIARYVRISPRKANQVLELIRGLPVDRAEEILQYTQRPIAKTIGKVLKSAVSNMTQADSEVAIESLYVQEAVVGAAPTMKKIMPRARGRANRILRRYSHIRIVVSPDEDGTKAKVSKKSKKAGNAK